MLLTLKNRSLLCGLLAAAVTLGVGAACSRSDRSDTGRDTTQTGAAATAADTQVSNTNQTSSTDTASVSPGTTDAAANQTTAAGTQSEAPRLSAPPADSAAQAQDRRISGYQPSDSSQAAVADSAVPEAAAAGGQANPNPPSDVTVGDSAQQGRSGERLEPTAAEQQANADTGAQTEPVRPPEDSSETLGRVSTSDSSAIAVVDTSANEQGADSTVSGYEPMARDTATVLAQGDSSQIREDESAPVETDSTALEARADTAQQDQARTDTLATDSEPIRPPEDSTETYGQVNGRSNADSVSHEERIRPAEDSTEVLGQVTTDEQKANAGRMETDQAVTGAARVQSTGNIATGADAVALMSRAGKACRIENSRDEQWDLAESPATLNPCGTGTMTLPKVQTGAK